MTLLATRKLGFHQTCTTGDCEGQQTETGLCLQSTFDSSSGWVPHGGEEQREGSFVNDRASGLAFSLSEPANTPPCSSPA